MGLCVHAHESLYLLFSIQYDDQSHASVRTRYDIRTLHLCVASFQELHRQYVLRISEQTDTFEFCMTEVGAATALPSCTFFTLTAAAIPSSRSSFHIVCGPKRLYWLDSRTACCLLPASRLLISNTTDVSRLYDTARSLINACLQTSIRGWRWPLLKALRLVRVYIRWYVTSTRWYHTRVHTTVPVSCTYLLGAFYNVPQNAPHVGTSKSISLPSPLTARASKSVRC